MSFEKEFQNMWDSPPNHDLVFVKPVDYTWWYGKSALVLVLKNKCSYCGLSIDAPYLQHEDCIKLQIEVEKNSIRR